MKGTTSALAAARTKAQCICVADRGWLRLDQDTLQLLRYEVLSRPDVEHAIEAMLAPGDITPDSAHGAGVVRLAGEAARRGDK